MSGGEPGSTVDALLAALAEPRRRATLEVLRNGPRAAGELARAVSLAPPAMSRHLKVLRESGLVEEGHEGPDARVRLYRLRPQGTAGLAAWIAALEAAWSQELAAFKAHVERR